jgi:hypothetical protein
MRARVGLAGLAAFFLAAIVQAATAPELVRLTPAEIAAMPSMRRAREPRG